MSLNRRQFLIAGAGLAVAAACGQRKEADVTVGEPSESAKGQLNLVVSSFVHVAGIDQRVTLAFLRGDMSPLRPEEPVQVRIDGEQVPAEVHDEGSRWRSTPSARASPPAPSTRWALMSL